MHTFLIIFLFIGTGELLLLGGVALLLFGGKKLPELMKGLGQGVQSFKNGMTEPLPENETPKQKKSEHSTTAESAKSPEMKDVKSDVKIDYPENTGKTDPQS